MDDAGTIEPILHLQDGLLAWLQNSVESADNRHGQNHVAISASNVNVSENVAQIPQMKFAIQLRCPFSIPLKTPLITLLFSLEPDTRATLAGC